MTSYRDLIVWQKSIDLVELIYVLTDALPDSEKYSLSNQMRRAAVSIPSNIAEGQGRSTSKEFSRFLSVARGSKHELETQLIICKRLGLLSERNIAPAMGLCGEIGRMLNSLMVKISDSSQN
ncbi:MAG: four helix bundle protein [Ruminococcus sp.]|nr:four helix bundle protein [Ruminococcus sp.]